MKESILRDEQIMSTDVIKKYYQSLYRRKVFKRCKKVYFAGQNLIGDYLFGAVETLNGATPLFEAVVAPEETLEALAEAQGPAVFFLFADATDLSKKEATLALWEKVFTYMKSNPGCRCVATVLLPKVPAFSKEVTALAEREYNFYIEQVAEKNEETDFYLELEGLCRKATQAGADLSLLRYSNVLAPDRAHTPGMDLHALVAECAAKKCVEITDADRQEIFSISYIRSACNDVFMSLEKARKGHIYNGDGMQYSLLDLKKTIHAASNIFALKTDLSAGEQKPEYRVLSSLKLQKTGIRPKRLMGAGIKHLVSYVAGAEYDAKENVEFYCGKIKTIQALEVEILKEIDRICQKHNINYFLAGGTLLGAVRQGCSIPWDDDLDIGMLREDFEKFKKVAKAELKPGFSYSGPKEGSHYTIDKIRLDPTYFSTNFSNKNVYPDGLFVDLLIYDKTSNNRLFQRLHSIVLTALTTVMLIKWYNTPRRNYHYTFSRIFLPLLRILPWGLFHGIFNFCAKWYRHKKNARWLIDSVGKKVYADPLPNEGLEETVYVDFEGIKAPIPVDPVPYLTYAYGPGYMELPTYSQRRCPHNFARIDLGKYVFDVQEERPFRAVDIRGELFEEPEKQ